MPKIQYGVVLVGYAVAAEKTITLTL